MNENFIKKFGHKRPIIIGAVHLPPSPGFKGHLGFDIAIRNALADAAALEEGGVDAIIFENNYDLPHTEKVESEVIAAMTKVGLELKRHAHVPLGISVLWNDYKSALEIAKVLDLSFIRVPVFVDTVKTSYGIIAGDAAEVMRVREELGAQNVLLFTDIHVKHAELLVDEPIENAAQRAIQAGSDALIITGKWTGDAPDLTELARLRVAVGTFPILCGSGIDEKNARALFAYADGAIVSTSLKEGISDPHNVNVKQYDNRISSEKTSALVVASQII